MSEIIPVEAASRRPHKSDAAFRTISEVSEDLDVPQHVLRFWESRFPTIKPLKRGGGRRYYRPEDVQLLRRIRDLLYKDGYTIRGVQKLLREPGRGDGGPDGDIAPAPVAAPAQPQPAAVVASPATPPAREAISVPVEPEPVAKPAPMPDRPASVAVSASSAALSGARRAMLESLLAEIDDLRATLAAALAKPPG